MLQRSFVLSNISKFEIAHLTASINTNHVQALVLDACSMKIITGLDIITFLIHFMSIIIFTASILSAILLRLWSYFCNMKVNYIIALDSCTIIL